jgi:hypothetical protein
MFGFYGMLVVEAYERYPECRCSTDVLLGLVWTLKWMFWPTAYMVLSPCAESSDGTRFTRTAR